MSAAAEEGGGPEEERGEWLARVVLEGAQRTLTLAIADTDRPVPCLLPGPDLWLSERRSERREAAKRCGSCPVLAECAALGAAVPLETWGVFGGHDYASDMEDLTELRALAGAVVTGRAGAAVRAKRDDVLARLGRDPAWSTVDLAEAAGLSRYQTSEVFRVHGVATRSLSRNTSAVDAEVAAEAEVAGVDGPLLEKLRGLGSPVNGPAGDVDRAARDRLMIELWESDQLLWTWPRLAVVADISTRHVRQIIGRYRRTGRLRRIQRDPAVTDPDEAQQRRRKVTAERWIRCEEEVAAFLTDPRVSRLRELTGLIPKGCPDEALKAEQAELLAALWADDPQFWTLERLASVCGHKSSSSARRILQRARRDDQAPRVCGALPEGRRRSGRAA